MKNLLISICAILFFTSCFQERIELDYNEDNTKVAIVAWISDLEEDQFISVKYTANYLGNEAQVAISNAICLLQNDTETITLIEGQAGFYFLPEDWIPQYGQEYTLDVTVGEQTYSATALMRTCPSIENVKFEPYTEGDFIDSLKYISLFSFQETPGEGDGYYVIDYLKGTSDGGQLRNGGFANDEFVDGEYFEDINISNEEDRLYNLGDTTIVELYSIGIEAVNFLADIENEIFRGTPFDAPPANIRSNFNNGAVGYFLMSGANRVEAIVE